MKELVSKLKSRKFLLALGAALTFLGQGDNQNAMITVLGYLVIEGGIDLLKIFLPPEKT